MPRLLKIYLIPDPVLYTTSKEIELNDPNIRALLEDMYHTNIGLNGVGLAANQVGLPIRAIVVDSDRVQPGKPHQHGGEPLLMINPVIIERSVETYTPTEACLSLPSISAQVMRHDWVSVEYYDKNWAKQRIGKATDLLGQCIQHEIDHIDGRVITDYLSPLKKQMSNKKVEKFAKNNEVYNYDEMTDARVLYRNFI